MTPRKRAARLPKSVETVRDVLAMDEVNGVAAWLDANKDKIGGLVLVAAMRDGTIEIQTAGVSTPSSVYLLEAGKAIVIEEDLWGGPEDGR